MEIKTTDGIEIYCLPDCAKCKLAGVSPVDLAECPQGCWECRPETCEYYEEEW